LVRFIEQTFENSTREELKLHATLFSAKQTR